MARSLGPGLGGKNTHTHTHACGQPQSCPRGSRPQTQTGPPPRLQPTIVIAVLSWELGSPFHLGKGKFLPPSGSLRPCSWSPWVLVQMDVHVRLTFPQTLVQAWLHQPGLWTLVPAPHLLRGKLRPEEQGVTRDKGRPQHQQPSQETTPSSWPGCAGELGCLLPTESQAVQLTGTHTPEPQRDWEGRVGPGSGAGPGMILFWLLVDLSS